MANGRAFWLTTTDNKFNFFEDFDNWYKFDMDPKHEYNCCGRITRLASTSPYFPDEINEMMIEQAIEDIIDLQLPMIGANGEEVYFVKCFEPSSDQLSKSDS